MSDFPQGALHRVGLPALVPTTPVLLKGRSDALHPVCTLVHM